jgi:hypothetical protein
MAFVRSRDKNTKKNLTFLFGRRLRHLLSAERRRRHERRATVAVRVVLSRDERVSAAQEVEGVVEVFAVTVVHRVVT